MLSRSNLIISVAICLCILSLIFAVQAGYLNLLSGREPYLWKSRYASAVNERDELLDQIWSMHSQLNSSIMRADELQLEVSKLGLELANLSEETKDLKVARDRLTREVNKLSADYESRNASCTQAETQVVNLTYHLNKTMKELMEAREERDQLKDWYSDARSQLDGIQENLSEMEEKIALLDDTNAELEGRIQAFEDAVSLKGEIHRTFKWIYMSERTWTKGNSGQKGTGFNRTEYISLATRRHIEDTENDSYAGLLSIRCDDIKELADLLYSQGTTDLQRVNNILKFVQYLPYIHDVDDDNYVRHPLETLVEGGGDCEDTSVLTAQLMMEAGPDGFPVVLLTVDTDNDDEVDHMMIGVSADGVEGRSYKVDGTDYYICETTSKWYRAGQVPSGYEIKEVIRVG